MRLIYAFLFLISPFFPKKLKPPSRRAVPAAFYQEFFRRKYPRKGQ
jgi:hypothetical protein